MNKILVVDGDVVNLTEIRQALNNTYKVDTADSGRTALAMLEQELPDLILVAVNMPDMSGFQLMDEVSEREEWSTVPVIMMATEDMDEDAEIKSFEFGAIDFLVKPIRKGSLIKRVERAIEFGSLKSSLERQIAGKAEALERLTLQSVTAFANVIDSKEDYTKGHSMRVAEYAVETATELGWSEEDIKKLRYAAILHDIGRVGVPESILNKKQALTDSEYELIKEHVYAGSEILRDIFVAKDLSNGAKYHHERFDGKGYPEGLEGNDIPIIARLISVADAFDAMKNPRPYRKALTRDEIKVELESGKGTQFDPEILNAFFRVWDNGGFDHVEDDIKKEEESDSSILLSRIMEKQNENIREKTEKDWLTNLYNRRYAELTIAEKLKTVDGTFFLMDIDNFKQINDIFGHMTGDTVLKIMADVIMEVATPDRDIAFRLGGDEYGVFVPGMTDIETAGKFAARLIAGYKQKQADNPYMKKSSVSVGAAISQFDGKSFDELYNKADKALYFVKQNGRNSFYCYTSNSEERKERSALGRKAELQRFADMIIKYGEKNGVFEVGYREFEQVFELASRFTKRNAQELQLVLFTLLPLDDDYKDALAQEEVMTILSEAIFSSLRRVDISVRFSSTQYLVALIDTKPQYISVVTDRIMQGFYTLYRGKDFVLDYDVAKVKKSSLE
ncbi:MAG: diguanylate cyclase [Lachnospiraceae bacterium]|nr:diguanylate cyclase [Lachnospiraceae bacterium]